MEHRFVLGRTDAETYLLPQRELLLTLHVPQHTAAMCVAQNEERLRRQVRSGRAKPTAMAWATDQTRLNSSRRALGQYANATSANQSGTPRNSASSSPSSPSPRSSSSSSAMCPALSKDDNVVKLLLSDTSYEVRALPGDVVYIPRGWGYEVQRILGTATLHKGRHTHDSSVTAHTPLHAAYEFRDHRALGGKHGTLVASPRPAQATTYGQDKGDDVSKKGEVGAATLEEVEALGGGGGAATATTLDITSIEVDALCLSYQPYPELTAAQAAVYVAANYVHSGVEEFYEKGGNQVFHSYE